MSEHRFTSAEDAMTFLQAGNAIITIVSRKTETRFTYRVKACKENGRLFFVSVLAGPDNTSSYHYIGVISDGVFKHTRKSTVTADASCFKAFAWTYGQLSLGRLPDQLEVWHEGKCGRCGKTLTVPESIANGIGPECAKFTAHRPTTQLAMAV